MKKVLVLLLIFSINILPADNDNLKTKIKNSLISAAYGDALGRVTEFISSLDEIFAEYPNGISSFKDFTESDLQDIPKKFKQENIYPYTDDTAMALLVLEALLESREKSLDLEDTMALISLKFVLDLKNPSGWAASFRAPGLCCKKYANQLFAKLYTIGISEKTWWKISPANGKTGGCGSVMRSYPFGLVFYSDTEKAQKWAAQHSCITHGDLSAQAACAAIAIGVAYSLQNKTREFIVDQMLNTAYKYDKITADKMKMAYEFAKKVKCNLGKIDVFSELKDKSGKFRNCHEKLFNTFLGWSAQDAIACVVYLFEMSNNVEEAIFLGANTPGDSDSIASIAGSLVGASSLKLDLNPKEYKLLENYNYIVSLSQKV